MPRPKGIPKTGGRKPGSRNRVTSSTKEWIASVVDNNREQLEKDLKSFDPVERWKVISGLLAFVVPKMSSVNAQIDYERLTDEQLQDVVSEVVKSIDNEDKTE